VGPVVAKLAGEPRAYGRTWHLGGAGATTQRAMLQRVERESGRKIKYLAANKTMLRLLGTFDPFMREFVEMHYLITEPFVLDDSALTALIGPIAKTSYDDGVRAMLADLQVGASAATISA
jgi:nucleoside-diphosphate-sugar epimerase